MKRTYCLILATLLLALSACGGGGGTTTGTGLTPLDFDVTTDPGSTVAGTTVIGYAVERTNPMYAEAETKIPAGYKLAAMLQFGPETPKGGGFSGDFTVRTTNHAVSSFSYGKMIVKYETKEDKDGRLILVRDGIAAATEGSAATFRFRMDHLGVVVLLEPTGTQFEVAAFADVASTPINTDINFWVLSRNGVEPITYSWNFGDGTTGAGETVTHSYPLLGDYNVTLTATDGAGNTAPVASTPISIVGNPVVLTQVTVDVTDNGDGSFDYSATLDGGSTPFDYDWDFDGDGTVDSREGAHVIWSPQSNLYRGTLTVTDQTGTTASTDYITDVRTITLTGGALEADPLHGYAPQPSHFAVTTKGTTSFDTITLDFGDGGSDTVLDQIDHTYDTTGVFTAVATLSRDVPGFGTISIQSNPILLTIDSRPDPRIDSVTPARAQVGQDVTLAGEFFFSQEPGDTVKINDLEMSIVSWTPTEVVVTVPAGAVDGVVVMDKKFPIRKSNKGPLDIAPTTPGQPGVGQL